MQAALERSFHVLIAEDDLDLRIGLQAYFELEGYEVTTARDGAEALDCLRRSPRYDLVLLDNIMPKMRGFEVLQETQTMPDRPPILMVTASGTQRERLNGFDLGVDDYIVKPFSATLLMARVRAVLQRPMPVRRAGDEAVPACIHTAYGSGYQFCRSD